MNIPSRAPIGYKHEDKKLVLDLITKDIVIRIYNFYVEDWILFYNTKRLKNKKESY